MITFVNGWQLLFSSPHLKLLGPLEPNLI